MTRAILQDKDTSTRTPDLYMAMELSSKKWKLGFNNGQEERIREMTVAAADLVGLLAVIERMKRKYGLPPEAKVVSCYEAGRDGFYLHRFLELKGVGNSVVSSSSIEVKRQARRAKTDRIDLRGLMSLLRRYHRGERKVWSVVHVLTEEEEDFREPMREREELIAEKTRYANRIGSCLVKNGILAGHPDRLTVDDIEKKRRYDGTGLPPNIKAKMVRLLERLKRLEAQIKQIEVWQKKMVKAGDTEGARKVKRLMEVKTVGLQFSSTLVGEVFNGRSYNNRRQVGSFVGVTGTPYTSGDSNRELGISKAGNRRARKVLVELAWLWLRWQPQSKLSQWYQERFAHGGKRMRRIGIVALARKLLIALWKYLEFGEMIEGAELRKVS